LVSVALQTVFIFMTMFNNQYYINNSVTQEANSHFVTLQTQ